jgi:hypothetical protein
MTLSAFRTLALSLELTQEAPHFDRIAFKVINRRIFATFHEASATANLKLTPADQVAFHAYDEQRIYPVPNKWGEKGWTTFEITELADDVIQAALYSAYNNVVGPVR